MPLFKYQAETGITGSASLPLAVVSGSATQSTPYSEGDITLTLPSVYGLMGAECVVDVPMLAVVGRGQDSIDGDVGFYSLVVDGDVLVASAIAGGFTLPRLTVDGNMHIDSEIVLRLLQVNGFMTITGMIDGAFIIPRISVSGTAKDVEYSSGAIPIKLLNVSGSVSEQKLACGAGSFAIPRIILFGHISNAVEYETTDDQILNYVEARRFI